MNLAVNNLLSRDEEGEEDGDDSQGDYVPEVEFSFRFILSIQIRNSFCFFLHFLSNLCVEKSKLALQYQVSSLTGTIHIKNFSNLFLLTV